MPEFFFSQRAEVLGASGVSFPRRGGFPARMISLNRQGCSDSLALAGLGLALWVNLLIKLTEVWNAYSLQWIREMTRRQSSKRLSGSRLDRGLVNVESVTIVICTPIRLVPW
jgi:hypothetical protein